MLNLNTASANPVSKRLAQWLATGALMIAGAAFVATTHADEHHGFGGMEDGPEHGMMMGGGSPDRMAHHFDRMLDGLGATEAQRSQIHQIAMSAAADMAARREAGRDLHQRAMQIFTAPTVDAAAAESLRQQMSAEHDWASKRMLQAMLDVAKVLTPEQRAKLGQRMAERDAVMKDRWVRMQKEHEQRMSAPAAPGALSK